MSPYIYALKDVMPVAKFFLIYTLMGEFECMHIRQIHIHGLICSRNTGIEITLNI